MGQYYQAVIVKHVGDKTEIKVISPHKFDNGYKLMEHSWVGNLFVKAVLNQLRNGGGELYWLGDYAKLEDMAHNKDWAFNKDNEKLFKQIRKNAWEREVSAPSLEEVDKETLYIVNHTKREVIDLKEYVNYIYKAGGEEGWTIHPIPILCSVGNGGGGGDYRGQDCEVAGKWAGDLIEVCDSMPDPAEYNNVAGDYIFIE